MIIAGTGHRPDKLGGYLPTIDSWLRAHLINELYAYHPKVEKVISGMALGFDMALAEAALGLNLPLSAYVPFIGQENLWPSSSITRYRDILNKADEVVVVCPGDFAVWKLHERNRRMVKDCDTLIALWNGDKSGGTFNCVQYAMGLNKEVNNCWSRWTLYKNQL